MCVGLDWIGLDHWMLVGLNGWGGLGWMPWINQSAPPGPGTAAVLVDWIQSIGLCVGGLDVGGDG